MPDKFNGDVLGDMNGGERPPPILGNPITGIL
jgi:hypothetical protein